jgi:iron complex transport system substrate-binding protein
VIGKEQAGPPEVLDQIRSAGVPVVIVAEPQTLEPVMDFARRG